MGRMTSRAKEHSREDIAAAIQMQGLVPLDIPATITVHDLADMMDTNPVEIIKELMRHGYMYTINEVMEHDIASSVADPMGFGILPLAEADTSRGSLVISQDDEDQDKLQNALQLSQFSATSTTAKLLCWTE